MLRLGMLLSFALFALGQAPEQHLFVSIDLTSAGGLDVTLRGPVPHNGPTQSRQVNRISALAFRADIALSELQPVLAEAGINKVDFTVTTPPMYFLRIDPAIPSQSSGLHGYYRAEYSLDQLPQHIVIDGGFEAGQVRTLIAAAVAMILSPFLLLVQRPSDQLRLRVQTEGIFVFGWICWIFVLLRSEAGPLIAYLFGRWPIAPLLVLMAPPLAAVWLGARLGGAEYARLVPEGLGAEYYRRITFWKGAAAVSIASTFLNILLSMFASSKGSLIIGFGGAALCVLAMRRISRGGRHPLADGDLRRRMFALAAKSGVNLRGVTILTSATPRPPAAFGTRWGVVLLNETLLRTLSRREVDAVVCHEFSHLRPVRRSALLGIYAILVGTILGTQLIPNFANIVPVSLLVSYFLIKIWRRSGEHAADSDSVRWSGDPEAMITGLARVSNASGMPMTWRAPVAWMVGHPPTLDRLYAIARVGGLSQSRVAELLEETQRPPVDHYVEAPRASVSEDAAFSPVLRKQMQTRLTVFALVSPIVFGISTVWLLERIGLDWRIVVVLGTLLSMLAMYVGAEWATGSVRSAAKRRAVARHGQGLYTGFSPSAEPRLFDGAYHYDLGIVRLGTEGLEFLGDRLRFTLDSRNVQRVWLGDGPRHWTPRKVVYVETESAIFSLQSFEAWCWPWTVAEAKRLCRQIEEWRQSSSHSPVPPVPCPLPREEGQPDSNISLRTAVRSSGIYSGVAFFLSSLIAPLKGAWDFSEVLCPTIVCGILALFLVWPRLGWGRLKTLADTQSRLPADS